MRQRRYETIVGIFVVASLAALLIMVLLIAKEERLWQKHVEYRAVFRNIAGLKTGNEVRLAGVTVGEVTKITISPQGSIIVIFEILAKYHDRIRQDSVASIASIGLLGDKCLEISAGSPNKPVIAPEGQVATAEPLDLSELLAKATPSLENLQKILGNLASLTEDMTKPDSAFQQSMNQIRGIITKVDQGQGTLGLIVNDPALYQEATKTVAATGKIMTDVSQGKGLMGTLIHDPTFKAQSQKTVNDMEATFANMKAAASRLPAIAQKSESFLESLNKAGKGLLTSGEEVVSDADKVAKGAQRSWLLRWNIPKSKERTLQVEREPGKD